MKKVLMMMAVAAWILLVAAVPVNAEEADNAVAGTVRKTDADIRVYQETSETSAGTAMLDEGTVVLITDENVGEGWCRISVREVTGYVRSEHLVPLSDSAEIDLEFEQLGNNYHMVFNEVQQLEKQRLHTRIWGTVIAVLVVGVFAAGLVPVVRKNRENGKNRT